MQLEALIGTYGYAAIVAGTLLEGELVVLVAGFLAHQGYLAPGGVVLSAFAGTLCADQFAYFVGRSRAAAAFFRRRRWNGAAERVFDLLRRRRIPLILGFRFLYGLRTVTPFAIGASGVRPREFAPLNAAGAAVWSAALTALGYTLGGAAAAASARYPMWMAGAAGCTVLLALFAGYRVRARAAARAGGGNAGR